MPSPGERQRNNVRTGIFVSVTLVLAVAIVIVISGEWSSLFSGLRTYAVDYQVRDGVSNLKSGADVRVGGVVMGSVSSVEAVFTDDSVEAIRVEFGLDDRIVLRDGAKVFVQSPLIGSDAWLEIPNLGTPDGAVVEERLDGAVSPGLLAALVGDESAQEAKKIISDVSETTGHAREISAKVNARFDTYDHDVSSFLSNMESASADVKELTERVARDDWPMWAGEVNELLAWMDSLTANLDGAVADGRAMIGDVRETISSNRPRLDATMANAEATSADAAKLMRHINEDSMKKADAILARAEEGIDSATTVLQNFEARSDRWSEDISGTLVNANLMATQLKLAAEEIRRSPWKLLHRPTDDELEHELLFGAARSFAVATADLRAAAASAESILDRYGERIDADGDLRARIEADLLGSLERYAAAQDRLLEAMMVGAGE